MRMCCFNTYENIFLFFDNFIKVNNLPWILTMTNYKKGRRKKERTERNVLIQHLKKILLFVCRQYLKILANFGTENLHIQDMLCVLVYICVYLCVNMCICVQICVYLCVQKHNAKWGGNQKIVVKVLISPQTYHITI